MDMSALHAYIFTDGSPQWRGWELFATTLDVVHGHFHQRWLLPVVSLPRTMLDRIGIRASHGKLFLIQSLRAFRRASIGGSNKRGSVKHLEHRTQIGKNKNRAEEARRGPKRGRRRSRSIEMGSKSGRRGAQGGQEGPKGGPRGLQGTQGGPEGGPRGPWGSAGFDDSCRDWAHGLPRGALVPQNAIGIIKINDFQKHVSERVRASMREPRKPTLSSQIPGATATIRTSWRPLFGAIGFLRKAPCTQHAIFPMTVVKNKGRLLRPALQ